MQLEMGVFFLFFLGELFERIYLSGIRFFFLFPSLSLSLSLHL